MILNKERMNSSLIFLILLGFTLRSFYFTSISLAPLPVISILLSLVVFFININNSDTPSRKFLFFISLLLLLFSLSIGLTIIYKDSNVNLNSIIGMNLNIIFFTCIYLNRTVYIRYVNKIKYVVLFHLVFFFIQLISFHFFGEKIDYLVSITGEVQRVNGFSSIEGKGLKMFRPSGLFNEPGNFSIHMLALLWIMNLSGKLKPTLEKIILISVVLSFSLSGIAAATVYVILTIKSEIRFKKIIPSFIILAIFCYYFNELIINYLLERLSSLSTDSSANVRLSAFSAITELPIYMQLFGGGLGNDLITIHLPTLPYLFVTFGVVGTIYIGLVFLWFGYNHNVDYKTYIFFIAMSFQFYTLMHPMFWVFWVYLFLLSEVRKDRDSYA